MKKRTEGFNLIVLACFLFVVISIFIQTQPIEAFAVKAQDGQDISEIQFAGNLSNSISRWEQLTSSAEWTGRFGHTSVKLPDDSIVLIGGNSFKKDVWRSTDNGFTWTRMTASAGWADWDTYEEGRYNHTSVVLPDGSIVLMGGWGGRPKYRNDVFRSTDKGATWTKMTGNTDWSGRSRHSSVALSDGSIVLMGGVDAAGSAGNKNDVWRSTDKGATWTRISSSAGWSGRYGHTSVVLPDGSIVLLGGAEQANYGYDTLKNDVWRSTDQGATWNRVTSSAEWGARSGHTSVVMSDGSIVLMGGSKSYGNYNDVWRSTDQGASWSEVSASAEWSGRSGHSSVALSNGSILLTGGGYGQNDVWRSTGASQAPVITDITPTYLEVQSTRQPLAIHGSNFADELELNLKAPDGNEYTIPRPDNPSINISDNRIDLNAGLYIAGTWQAKVINADGQESNSYSFEVKPKAIDAYIVNWSAEPRYVKVGQQVTLTMEFTNTGSQSSQFIAGASLWDPDNNKIDFNPNINPSHNQNPITLSPNQSHTVAWTYTINKPGGWDVQFAVWEKEPLDVPENLLVKEPSPKAVNYISATKEGPDKVQGPFSIGLYDPFGGFFFLQVGEAVEFVGYGARGAGWIGLSGDWNGDGLYAPGVYDPLDGRFWLQGANPETFTFGGRNSSRLPLAGDWNGDGKYGVGVYDHAEGKFYLRLEGGGIIEGRLGARGNDWIPVVVSNGSGGHTVALYDSADGNFHPYGLAPIRFGPRGSDWTPVTGDWNGDGTYGVGLHYDGHFHLNTGSIVRFGPRGFIDWIPVTGRW